MTPEEQTLIITFCKFLEKMGYLDSDWWLEKPTAIERFIQAQEKKKW